MADLVFTTPPTVSLANYVLTNVSVLLQVEDTPLIEIIHKPKLGYTTRFSVFDSQGNDVARVVGTTINATTKGKDTGITIEKEADGWICKLGQQTIFEIAQKDNNCTIQGSLFTPASTVIKLSNGTLQFLDLKNQIIPTKGNIQGGAINSVGIGVHVYSDGTIVTGQALEQ